VEPGREVTRRPARGIRVLGIDPGLTRCGYGVVDIAPDRSATLVTAGVIRTGADEALELRLLGIARGIDAVLDEFAPDRVAVERVFAQLNVRTVMGTAQASGIALERAAARGLPVGLHTPTEVKAAVTGFGQADKRQVGAMIARILRLEAAPKPADAADAVALALTHGWRGSQAGPSPDGGPPATPTQRAWREAERAARR